MAGRGILSPTGRPKSDRADRRRIPVGRRLFSVPATSSDMACKQTWSREEDKALVEFVLFHSDPAVWPSHSKNSKFWTDAATFVQQRSKAFVQRNGSSLILTGTPNHEIIIVPLLVWELAFSSTACYNYWRTFR